MVRHKKYENTSPWMLDMAIFQPGVEPMVTVRRGVLVWVEPTVLTVVGVGLFILLLVLINCCCCCCCFICILLILTAGGVK